MIETSYLDQLRSFFGRYSNIPLSEWAQVVPKLKLKTVNKNQYLFRCGDNFDELGFIVSGLFYQFYTDKKGNVATKAILQKGQLVAPYRALLTNQPADFDCRALKKSVIVTLNYRSFVKMFEKNDCWERLGRKVAEDLFVKKELREMQLLTLDAARRYEIFLEEYGSTANEVPQSLIASYIGVNPASLSRLRRKRITS